MQQPCQSHLLFKFNELRKESVAFIHQHDRQASTMLKIPFRFELDGPLLSNGVTPISTFCEIFVNSRLALFLPNQKSLMLPSGGTHMDLKIGMRKFLVIAILAVAAPHAAVATEEKPASLEAIIEELSALRSLVE